MSGADTDMAVRLIFRACGELFKDNGREEWAECILDNTANTGSDLAIRMIATVCSRTEKNNDSKADRCILRKLPGTDSDLATKQIVKSCRD